MEGVDLIIHNEQKDDMAKILPEKLPELFTSEPDKNCSTLVADFFDHNRAWVKISDGCNQWCSYCIIPSVRGRIKNRPAGDIIEEINNLVEHGYNEVVLTGVNLGHYRNRKTEPQVKNLANLCRMIMKETSLARIRISSIEPQTVRDELLEVYAESNGRICRHIHLPMQSGASRILKLMKRPYNKEIYLAKAEAIKTAVPQTIIGADVIVGFPGETDADFNETKDVVMSGLIDYLHVFSYSDRPGTLANEIKEKVNPETAKERNTILTRLSSEILQKAHDRQVGEILEVIAQHKVNNLGGYWAVADNYLKVNLPNNCDYGKNIVKVKVTKSFGEYISGDIISNS